MPTNLFLLLLLFLSFFLSFFLSSDCIYLIILGVDLIVTLDHSQ